VNRLAARGLPPGAIAEPVRALDCGKLRDLEFGNHSGSYYVTEVPIM